MMQHIDATLKAAVDSAPTFERNEVEQILSWLATQMDGAVLDWDEGAGENWGRVLVGKSVAAFVCTKARLVIFADAPENIVSGLVDRGVLVIRVADMDAECLCSDRSMIMSLAERPLSDAFDHHAFSAQDLVWATM